jgi:hypothetical protein
MMRDEPQARQHDLPLVTFYALGTSPPTLPGVIRRAVPDETTYLNALTGRSVLCWGTESNFLTWEPDLGEEVRTEQVAEEP